MALCFFTDPSTYDVRAGGDAHFPHMDAQTAHNMRDPEWLTGWWMWGRGTMETAIIMKLQMRKR